jgi:hypothetical protein
MDDLDAVRSFGADGDEMTDELMEAVRSRVEVAIHQEARRVGRRLVPDFSRRFGWSPIVILAGIASSLLIAAAIGSVLKAPPEVSAGATQVPTRSGVGTVRSPGAPGVGAYPGDALFDPQTPLLAGGQEVSLSEAVSLVGHPLYQPDWTGADRPQVWVVGFKDETGEESYEAALRYGQSLVVLYAQWPAGTDVKTRYESEVSDWEQGYVTTIASHPAWVVSSDENAVDTSVSVVRITIGTQEVQLLGKMSADDLVAIASTLHD